jgi:FMN phosphatase YigB (HAD superfamily)
MNGDFVFLVDVDNTLLDNDRIIADLHAQLAAEFGAPEAATYWTILEALRDELGYVDYLCALRRWRGGFEPGSTAAHRLLSVSSFLIDYSFAERVYPRALDLLARLRAHGPTVILSDGDAVFQPRKVQRAGLWDAVGGEVLIVVHKEQMLDAVQRRYPARRYVVVDDKPHILAAIKDIWRERAVTVFVRQGHYAHQPAPAAQRPEHAGPDFTVECIGDLMDIDIRTLTGEATKDTP